MKITDVKVETIRIPMKKPFRIAFAVQDHSLNVLVKISTDEGLWGIGEAAPFEPVTGESAAVSVFGKHTVEKNTVAAKLLHPCKVHGFGEL